MGMCTDIWYTGMLVDMCIDMCVDMRVGIVSRAKAAGGFKKKGKGVKKGVGTLKKGKK